MRIRELGLPNNIENARIRAIISATTMDGWDRPLTYVITPKSGPLRRMKTLRDARRALIEELPKGYLKHPHWVRAALLLVIAAETGDYVEWTFEAIVAAVAAEGWFTRSMTESHGTTRGVAA